MKTIYATSIPPGISSSTRGHLKVRVDRVVLDLEPVQQICGDAARRVVESPHLSFHWWGGEDKPSPVLLCNSLSTRTGASCLVFPIKTSRAQIEAYFKHMTAARSGLEIRVLAHDLGKGGSGAGAGATHAETASAAIGRALIRLDEMTPAHPMAGWFSVVALPEDGQGFSPIASLGAHCVLGRVKLAITLEFFNANEGPADTVVMATAEEQQQQQQRNQLARPHRLKETLPRPQQEESENASNSNNNSNRNDLIVVGHAITLPSANEVAAANETDAAIAAKQKSSRSSSAENRKPPVPPARKASAASASSSSSPAGGGIVGGSPSSRAASSHSNSNSNPTHHVINEDADKLFQAGLKLRQQLANAARSETVDDVMENQRNRKRNNDNDDDNDNDPYAPLHLRIPPHDERYPGERVTDALIGNESDDEEEGDNDHGFSYFDPTLGISLPAGGGGKKSKHHHKKNKHHHQHGNHQQQETIVVHHVAPPPQSLGSTARPNEQQPQQTQSNANQQQQQHQHQRQQQQSGFYQPPPQSQQPPSQFNTLLQQQQAVTSNSNNALTGAFIVRVCIGQLALQQPCSAVKLVARFSPDVLFTSPPELGCFVSPDVELPIADDDVVGFNVAGIRRLSTASRVVLELYAAGNKNNNNNSQRREGDDDFQLVGLAMAPICGSAATGVLRNVVLRNPLNAGSVQAQCDVYVTFFQEEEPHRVKQQQQPPVLPAGVRPFVGAADQAHQQNQQQQQAQQQNQQQNQPPQQPASENGDPRRSTSPQDGTAANVNSNINADQQNQQQQQQSSRQSSASRFERRGSNASSVGGAGAGGALAVIPANQQLTTTNENENNSSSKTKFAIKIIEARNLRPIKDGALVRTPNCFAVIDDVMLQPARPTTGIEMPSLGWRVLGPDATFIARGSSNDIDDSNGIDDGCSGAPRFNFSTVLEVDEDDKQLSRLCISVHHCRNAELLEVFSSSSAAKKKNSSDSEPPAGVFLDPEREPRVIDLLESSVELGVISLSTKCLPVLPFDGWAHAVDSVTGDSVGQFRVKCEKL